VHLVSGGGFPGVVAPPHAIAESQNVLVTVAERAEGREERTLAVPDRSWKFGVADKVAQLDAGEHGSGARRGLPGPGEAVGQAAAGADPDAPVLVRPHAVGVAVFPDEAGAAAVVRPAAVPKNVYARIRAGPEPSAVVDGERVNLVRMQAAAGVEVLRPESGAGAGEARNAVRLGVGDPHFVLARGDGLNGGIAQAVGSAESPPTARVSQEETFGARDPESAPAVERALQIGFRGSAARQRNGLKAHASGGHGSAVERARRADPEGAVRFLDDALHDDLAEARFRAVEANEFAAAVEPAQADWSGSYPDGAVAADGDRPGAGAGRAIPGGGVPPGVGAGGPNAEAGIGADPDAARGIAADGPDGIVQQAVGFGPGFPFAVAEPASQTRAADSDPDRALVIDQHAGDRHADPSGAGDCRPGPSFVEQEQPFHSGHGDFAAGKELEPGGRG